MLPSTWKSSAIGTVGEVLTLAPNLSRKYAHVPHGTTLSFASPVEPRRAPFCPLLAPLGPFTLSSEQGSRSPMSPLPPEYSVRERCSPRSLREFDRTTDSLLHPFARTPDAPREVERHYCSNCSRSNRKIEGIKGTLVDARYRAGSRAIVAFHGIANCLKQVPVVLELGHVGFGVQGRREVSAHLPVSPCFCTSTIFLRYKPVTRYTVF